MSQMNLSTEQKQTHRHGEQTNSCHKKIQWRTDGWEFEVYRWKLVYVEWINNKVLQYTAGNIFNLHTQSPVINCNRTKCMCM